MMLHFFQYLACVVNMKMIFHYTNSPIYSHVIILIRNTGRRLMKNLNKLLRGIMIGYTSFYGIPNNASTDDPAIKGSNFDDQLDLTPINEKIKIPDHVLRVPERTESGLFASHRSHRSHYSSSTGGGSYTKPKKKYVPIPAAPVIKDTTLGVRVLEKGLSGPDVLHLERLLLSKGYKLIKPNRYFDEKTELVVKDFQKKTGIQADGKVGPLTIYYLTND